MIKPDKTSQTQIQKYYKKLNYITKRFQTQGHNQFQLCKQQFDDPFQYFHKIVKDVQVTQKVIERLYKIRQLPRHQNIISVCSTGYHRQKKQIYVLSEYFQESQSLKSMIEDEREDKRRLTEGELKFIIYQVIQGMKFLEQNQMNHLRLNPESILIKFPEQKWLQKQYQKHKKKDQSALDQPHYKYYKYPLAKICDIGIATQQGYMHQYCLHPDLHDKTNGDCYQRSSAEKGIIYDFWALGSIIYFALKQKKPFYGKQSFYSDKKIFKLQYAKDPRSWLNKKQENNFSRKDLLQTFVYKCWGINGERLFRSWRQANEFFQESEFRATRMQKMPIDKIFENHVRLMFLFSKIYIIMVEEAYHTNSNANHSINLNNSPTLEKLASYIFQLAYAYHLEQFENNFKNRCYSLPFYKRKMLASITLGFKNQLQYLLKFSKFCQNRYSFEDLISHLTNKIIDHKVKYAPIYDQQKRSITLLRQFYENLTSCMKVSLRYKQSPDMDWCDVLNVMYECPAFQNMANNLGFQIPNAQL